MTNASLLERLEAISRCIQCGEIAHARGVLDHLIRDVRHLECHRQPDCEPAPTPCKCLDLLYSLPPGTVVNFNIQTPCK